MTPLQEFARTVTHARKIFDADRSRIAWLVFYQAKEKAYAKLVAALPQVKEIEDFWRYVQNMAPLAWLPIIEREVLRITKSRYLCARCQEVRVSWPERFCDECRKIRRSEAATKSRQTRRLKQQMRKCPICKTTPLQPRERKCADCKQSARRDRNRRYQKSLKESKIRRLQPNLTREPMLTVSGTDQLGSPHPTVNGEGVFSGTCLMSTGYDSFTPSDDNGAFQSRETHEGRECLEFRTSRKSPGFHECHVSPVSNGQGLKKELEALAAECGCIRAEDSPSEKVFELARGVRALEKKGGWRLETSERLFVFKKWHEASKPFLDDTNDYLAEFLAAIPKVRVPKGEGDTINKAIEKVLKLSVAELRTIVQVPGAPEAWRRIFALHCELSVFQPKRTKPIS